MADLQARIKVLALVAKEIGYTDKEALQYTRDADTEMRLEEREKRQRESSSGRVKGDRESSSGRARKNAKWGEHTSSASEN